MKKYKEVPQWWYLILFLVSLAVGIGCSVRLMVFVESHCVLTICSVVQYYQGTWLLPAWSVILFTVISSIIAVCIGFSMCL